MSDGQISVDLRLALKRLKDDIRDANKMIKEGLSKSLNLGGGGGSAAKETKDSGAAMDQLAIKTKRVTSALAEQLNAWKKLQNFRKPKISIYGQDQMPKADYTQYGPTMNPTQGSMGPGGGLATTPSMAQPPPIPKGRTMPVVPSISAQDAATFWRRMLTGSMAAMRGGAYGNVIGANQMFGALSQTATGGRALGGVGLAGAGGAAAVTGGLLIALLAVKTALEGMRKVLLETIAASDRARILYAKSLQSGLGTSFTSKRGNLASVLGVGEQEVYQFGNAMAVLNPKLEFASKISAQTATTLAPLSYELRILKLNTEALFAHIAMDVAPTLSKLVNGFSNLTKAMLSLYDNVIKPIFAVVYDTLNSKAGKLLQHAIPGLDQVKELFKVIMDAGKPIGKLSEPQAFMKQMPVSSYERMGLVAGMASSPMVDYSRRTAIATETIAKHVANMGNHGGVVRAFNLDPEVATP